LHRLEIHTIAYTFAETTMPRSTNILLAVYPVPPPLAGRLALEYGCLPDAPWKVVNDVAAQLRSTTLQGSELLLTFLQGLQSGMDAETILEALVSGEMIEAPPVKKRGRKRKEPVTEFLR
jgi:hypothetical protein